MELLARQPKATDAGVCPPPVGQCRQRLPDQMGGVSDQGIAAGGAGSDSSRD